MTKTSYEDRKGVTQEPFAQDDYILSISPLHCLMRVFDWIKTLIYHLSSETFKWFESKIQQGASYSHYIQAQDTIKAALAVPEINIPLDACDPTGMGGNSNKDDLCQRLLTDLSWNI